MDAQSLPEESDSSSFESHFRDPALAAEAPLAWLLGQRLDILDALRGLLSGGQATARLRLWVFLELAAQPQGRLQREDLNQLFFSLRPEALDATLKRLRDLDLLVWDATDQDYHLSALAQQLQSLLAPLARSASEDDEMAALLAQVAGAQALGLSDAGQIQHLHAQLARRHDEFADVIASGSEARLREAQPRFERALQLVERAGEALTALIRGDHDDPRLEREARALGRGQARLLSMASQFTRALQQADRRRITLGSTGITSSDVRQWLQTRGELYELLGDALSSSPHPVFISGHELVDVAEAEFDRDRPDPHRVQGLPPAARAESGTLEALRMPEELETLIGQLAQWTASAPPGTRPCSHPITDAVLGGRYAQSAYRMQLLPLLGDEQARALQGLTGDLARSPWHATLQPELLATQDPYVAFVSAGTLEPDFPDDSHA
ncbi:MAG: hypothetical protein RBR29_03310 [Castellaniella sp.]|uniref:hypothetical protein n=1 Tax=Castellaniella sp. TaxID=1955812 RepID=UPI002A36BC56|nr:hypothetical protein [Castellaniella sp.]MDY0308807.1 hypothetical protein [Castellaniella sp.]